MNRDRDKDKVRIRTRIWGKDEDVRMRTGIGIRIRVGLGIGIMIKVRIRMGTRTRKERIGSFFLLHKRNPSSCAVVDPSPKEIMPFTWGQGELPLTPGRQAKVQQSMPAQLFPSSSCLRRRVDGRIRTAIGI